MLRKKDHSPVCHAAYAQSHILMGCLAYQCAEDKLFVVGCSKNMMNRDCHRPEENGSCKI